MRSPERVSWSTAGATGWHDESFLFRWKKKARMRILFISDGQSEADWLAHALRESAHSLQRVDDIRDGIFLAGQERFDAVIVIATVSSTYARLTAAIDPLSRTDRSAILIALLGEATARDRARVLRAGADACLSQPHSLLELNERMRALRRLRVAHGCGDETPASSIRLDAATREIVADDRRVAMTPREFLAIECLLREPGTPVSRERLICYAWPDSNDTDPASVNTIVSRLRRKFARDLPQVRIDTVSCLGYRIVLASTNP
ncbi:response regulator transcription factor [Burkholderia ubonensis]|uniref:response regulator transcription factor n=1 Tax=Burkholderia ubonensis TaxID=101571 RepID=UPI001E526853|nr:response regulator transcription factor [Burkholderia ubonensis]